jgi:uncharacterized membrane protein HdeD (DUF308 family)
MKWLVCEGLLDLLVATILIFNPFIAVIALPLIIGGWILVRAIIKLWHFTYLPKTLNGRYYVLIAGLLSAVAGIFIILLPPKMITQVSYGMSLVLFVFGGLYIVDAIRFRHNKTMLAAIV